MCSSNYGTPFRSSRRKGRRSGGVQGPSILHKRLMRLTSDPVPNIPTWRLLSWLHFGGTTFLVRGSFEPEEWLESPTIASAVPGYPSSPSIVRIYCCILDPVTNPTSSGAGPCTLVVLQDSNPLKFGSSSLWCGAAAHASQFGRTLGPKRRFLSSYRDISSPTHDSTMMSGLQSQIQLSQFLVACGM